MSNAIRYELDDDGIATLTIDIPGQSANTMNAAYREGMADILAKLRQDGERVCGVIVASAKSTFFAGGDLNELIQADPQHADAMFALVEEIKGLLRQLETFGPPVVAAINGTALGGGMEVVLACHWRIAIDHPKAQFGFPEVTLGLLPGGGGVARLTRLLGLQAALPHLMEGKRLSAKQALAAGLVDELAVGVDDLLQRARDWIRANPDFKQPWDRDDYKMPGGTPSYPKVAQVLVVAPAMLRAKTHGCYPAPEAILAAAVEGAQVDFSTASRIESRYFVKLAVGQVAKNMIGTFWFQLNQLKAGGSRPKAVSPWRSDKVGIIGAGMMGAGIAYACASRKLAVVLKDTSLAAAEKGKRHSADLLTKRVAKGQMAQSAADGILELILPTADAADFAGCDLVIEAVYEDRALKAKVTQEAERVVSPGVLMASNTPTLPISGLAAASSRPERFIGLHFFSPVDKMELVEIVRGHDTSDETLARAFDFVMQIGKTPIVVNDGRGFFTSRVFGTYINEGVAMLGEGLPAPAVEMAALQAGMPVGPLAVVDEVSLSLIDQISKQARADLEASGQVYQAHPAELVFDCMLRDHQRAGKAAGAGFYDYPADGGKKRLWPGLAKIWGKQEVPVLMQDMVDRMLFVQALETVRCLEEGILNSVVDANIGSIFGIGFPAWTGGAIQYINQYGLPAFIGRADQLAKRYGARFESPALLREMAVKEQHFA
ncbi:3-hydroxyacyl-CoA dehydrogenase NAD-binding domain-containing protein [Chitinivorax sp. B]|uniref:3-hydroxyacyl-CoA dehydrogenase NAD-binding domain-containing protein n=1 Tax=Chitinivorax sp. B TaxID=2502235 RepID=UPI0010F52E7F|nr:3-hydroxyacyl-CoA dehydrogenase NAD-binding domain-containing protein [Chitinivorax sp. B]